jgi:hypothetical protein
LPLSRRRERLAGSFPIQRLFPTFVRGSQLFVRKIVVGRGFSRDIIGSTAPAFSR